MLRLFVLGFRYVACELRASYLFRSAARGLRRPRSNPLAADLIDSIRYDVRQNFWKEMCLGEVCVIIFGPVNQRDFSKNGLLDTAKIKDAKYTKTNSLK